MLTLEVFLFLLTCAVGVGGYRFGRRDGYRDGFFAGRNDGQRPFLQALEARGARRQ